MLIECFFVRFTYIFIAYNVLLLFGVINDDDELKSIFSSSHIWCHNCKVPFGKLWTCCVLQNCAGARGLFSNRGSWSNIKLDISIILTSARH